ncbi:MAG: helix-turn-helix domain-containing protein [Desulfocapsaceae bacterium]
MTTDNLQEKVIILDASVPEGLQLMRACYRNQRFSRHSHEGYGFGVVERGTLCFRYLGVDHSAPKGMINLVCPGECHDGHGKTAEGWSYRMFYIAPELMTSLVGGDEKKSSSLPFFRAGVIDNKELATQLVQSHRYIIEHPTENLAIEEFISCFITSLVRAYGDEKLQRPRPLIGAQQIKIVVEKLEDEFRENHRLETLSAIAGISKYHFIRVFRENTGLTPHKYLNQTRIKRSEQMLREGLDLSEVAYQTGFSDQSHFSRMFKSIKGISPGAFRNFVQDDHN